MGAVVMVRVDRKPGVVLVTDPPRGGSRDEAVAFITELIRLQRDVRQLHRDLDRLEGEMHEALSGLALARFKEYR